MFAAIQESQHPHTVEEGGHKKTTPEGELVGGTYKWYYSSGIDPKIHEELEKLRKMMRSTLLSRPSLGAISTLHPDYMI